MKNDQRRQKAAEEIRRLSEAMGSLAIKARWATRDVRDDRAEDIRVGAAEAAELLFTLARDVASGRVELDGPDSPRPLFDRPAAEGDGIDGIIARTLAREADRGERRVRGVQPGPDGLVDAAGTDRPRGYPGRHRDAGEEALPDGPIAAYRPEELDRPEDRRGASEGDGQREGLPGGTGGVVGSEPTPKPKPRTKRKSDRSFDLLTKGGEWVARIWAEDSGVAWGLANTAFTAFFEKPSGFVIEPASAKHYMDAIHAGGKRLRDIAWESGDEKGRERFYMASKDSVGIPAGAPIPAGRTLEEQGYIAGVGPTEDRLDWHSYDAFLPDEGEGKPRSFLGNILAPSLAEAIARAPGRFEQQIQPGTRLEVAPGPAGPGEPWHFRTELSECATCGKRWPKAEAVGCPDCVHALGEVAARAPSKPRKPAERTFEVFYRDDGDALIPLGQLKARNLDEASQRACQAYVGEEVNASEVGTQLISQEDLVVKGPIAPARNRKESVA